MGWLRKLIAIILIVIAIIYGFAWILEAYFSVAATTLPTWLMFLGTKGLALIAFMSLVGAALVDAEEVAAVFSAVGTAIGDVGGALIGGVGAAISATAGGSGLLTFALLAVGGYFAFNYFTNKKDQTVTKIEPQNQKQDNETQSGQSKLATEG